MDRSFTYYDPLFPSEVNRTNEYPWEKVLQSHKQQDYRGVILGILDFVDPELAARTGNADRSQFDIPHGSISLQLSLSDQQFSVKAPFLDIAESKRIPLMRKVTELNFSPLNLSSIHLSDDKLSFRYSCALSLCEPYRTYDALREICIYADSYDDEFITKFDAKWIRDPRVEPYPPEIRQKAWDHLQEDIRSAKEGMRYFESKRNFNLSWDVVVITLMKAVDYMRPEGMLRTDLEKMISYLTTSEDPMNEKSNRGKSFLEKLENYTREAFDSDLYRTDTFIPYKVRNDAAAFRSRSEDAYNQARNEIEQNHHLGAAMTLYYQFLYSFYHISIPADIERSMRKALKQASGKEWKEAAEILYGALNGIMNGEPDQGRNRGGFFKRVFGRKE